jgi:hypothetical protein
MTTTLKDDRIERIFQLLEEYFRYNAMAPPNGGFWIDYTDSEYYKHREQRMTIILDKFMLLMNKWIKDD